MANHVTFSFDIENVNEEGQKFLGNVFEGKDDLHQTEFEGQNLSECGPKWATIEETDSYDTTFTVFGESAWSPPTDYLEALHGALLKVSPEATATIHYTDEAPNFAGVYFFEPVDDGNGGKDTCIDGVELDNEEIFELWSEEYSEDFNNALEIVAEEEGIAKSELLEQQEDFYNLIDYDEIQDAYSDSVWDVISNYQSEQLNILKGG